MKRALIAIVKDNDDMALWSPYISSISECIYIHHDESLPETISNLAGNNVNQPLFIVSTKLYPANAPTLIEDIRTLFPGCEFLLIASNSDSFPPLKPLVQDNVRHLVINPESSPLLNVDRESAQFCTAVIKLIEGNPLKIYDYLRPGTKIYEFKVCSSDQKEELIAGLEGLIVGDGPDFELLRQKGALLVDEMFENALYGAPHEQDGAIIYARGEFRQVDSRENIVLRYGFDGECIAMEMEDNWGSLSPDTVLECIATNHENSENCEEIGGRGIFIIWRFLDHLHVHIDPGRQTVVGGQVKLVTAENLVEKKGFHITTCHANQTAGKIFSTCH